MTTEISLDVLSKQLLNRIRNLIMMTEIITLIGIFIIGIIASIIGTMVGGGSIVSIIFLIFIGLPPQVAIATDRLGSLGQTITAFLKFLKAKKIVWKYVPILALISLAGSLIGANILLNVNPKILQKIVGIILLLLLPVIFLKKEVGVEHNTPKKLNMLIGIALYFMVQIFAGFFGGGTGSLIFYILMIFFGLSIIETSATMIIPGFVLMISSVVIFALNGILDYKIGFVLMMGMATGGYIGAHIALKKGSKWIKGLFTVIVIISAVKLLFF